MLFKTYDVILATENGHVKTIEKKTLAVPFSDGFAIDLLDELYKKGSLDYEDENRKLLAIVNSYATKKEIQK